jgi:hypothetical protein
MGKKKKKKKEEDLDNIYIGCMIIPSVTIYYWAANCFNPKKKKKRRREEFHVKVGNGSNPHIWKRWANHNLVRIFL